MSATSRRRGAPSRPTRTGLVLAVLALLATGCGLVGKGSSAQGAAQPADAVASATTVTTVAPTTTTTHVPDPHAFDAADAALKSRVANAGIAGGVLLVVKDGHVIHDVSTGSVTDSTLLQVQSSTKLMTSVLMMMLVEQGKVSLDAPISQWLPEFTGSASAITLRESLDHTSGVRDLSCLWDGYSTLSSCVSQVAKTPLEFPPGTAFSYSNADFHVAGRLAEVLTGTDFQTLFAQMITTPLGMVNTHFGPTGRTGNPSPAAGAYTTVDDYSHLLAMLAAGGVYQNKRYLTPASVAEIEKDQVVGHDTSQDFAVNITKVPTYGLGLWRDKVDANDKATVVSGNGGGGFYPWIDHVNNAYGIVGVEDDRGANVAVPASQVVFKAALAATPAA